MNAFSIRKTKWVVWIVVPFFIFSFFSSVIPLEASSEYPRSNTNIFQVPAAVPNPLATQAEDFYIPPDAVRVGGRIDGRTSQVYLDPQNTDRIYLLSETSRDGVLTLQYIYNDLLSTVTLLSSFTKKDAEPSFTHYYRYAQGAHSTLELILDEGWVKGNAWLPSRLYDYFRGVVSIRSFDRAGNLLKLESSEGTTRHFIYSRDGRLLTIEESDPLGELSFYDQASNARDWDLPPVNLNEDRRLFVLPQRELDKHRTALAFFQKGRSDADGAGQGDPLVEGPVSSFLNWLELAHPLRAGPGGAIL